MRVLEKGDRSSLFFRITKHSRSHKMHRYALLSLGLFWSASHAQSIQGPVITANFPDPSVVQTPSGEWYAFATNNGVYNAQVAVSKDFENWTVLNQDALPNMGSWSDGTNLWAPDVRLIVSPTSKAATRS